MTKNKGGRPLKVDENVLQKLESAFSWGCTDREACVYAGIAPATLYTYCDRNPSFKERKELLKESTTIHAKRNIAESVTSGDKSDSKRHLERRKSDEYNTLQKKENRYTDKDGEDLKAEDIAILRRMGVPIVEKKESEDEE